MRAAGLALALLFAPAAGAQDVPPIPVYGFEVVRVWPHDRTAFTQGLTWHEGTLLESTGRYPSTVRRGHSARGSRTGGLSGNCSPVERTDPRLSRDLSISRADLRA